MKYYSEEDMKDIRLALENEVLHWGRVSLRNMFGCPCYKVNEQLFVFLVTKGIVFTRLNEADRLDLSSQFHTTSFKAGGRDMKNWLQVTVTKVEDLKNLMSFVRKCYEEVKKQTDFQTK